MKYLLVAALVACSCAHFDAPHYTTTQRQRDSVYRVSVSCSTDGTLGVSGSAVAIGPRTLLTAKHVTQACQDHLGVEPWVMTVENDLGKYEVVEGECSRFNDACQLTLVGMRQFRTWAPVADYLPDFLRGEEVCTEGAQAEVYPVRKCGPVIREQGRYVFVSSHGVPGNSGSPVFNYKGEVVGLLVVGQWAEGKEYLYGYTPASYWKELWRRG